MQKYHTANEAAKPAQLPLFETSYGRTPVPPQPPANASPQSQAAAESIRDAAPTLRTQVFESICKAGSRGQTRHEISESTGIALHTICPRIGELKRMGMIVESGTRPSPTGRAAGILKAAQHERNPSC